MNAEIKLKLCTTFTTIGLFANFVVLNNVFSDQQLSTTFENGGHSAEVQVDHSKVTVRLKRDTDDNPQYVLATFFDQNYKSMIVALSNLAPPNSEGSGDSTYAGTFLDSHVLGQGSSSLSPSQQSFVGIELRIPFSQDGPEVFLLKPNE